MENLLGTLILFVFLLIVNTFVVWLGLIISGLTTSLRGLVIIGASLSVPHLFLPWFMAGSCGVILFWIAALKFTSADGPLDIIVLNGVTNIVSTWVSIFIIMSGIGIMSTVSSDEDVGDAYAASAAEDHESADLDSSQPQKPQRPTSAYAAYRDQLSDAELGAIERAVRGPN